MRKKMEFTKSPRQRFPGDRKWENEDNPLRKKPAKNEPLKDNPKEETETENG